ncbi:hypothetical protein CLF_105622 [Clonorchis sinensis]|uniref:Uncharacterized protein n=1 Tax=Clonorchis sinensis TaxID=79923 RepID=G7YDU5_CLOSI|nr:hypothetical protein CLF_105622 [Clonorchis sinensis]
MIKCYRKDRNGSEASVLTTDVMLLMMIMILYGQYRLGQPGSIPALVIRSGGMAAMYRKGVTTEQYRSTCDASSTKTLKGRVDYHRCFNEIHMKAPAVWARGDLRFCRVTASVSGGYHNFRHEQKFSCKHSACPFTSGHTDPLTAKMHLEDQGSEQKQNQVQESKMQLQAAAVYSGAILANEQQELESLLEEVDKSTSEALFKPSNQSPCTITKAANTFGGIFGNSGVRSPAALTPENHQLDGYHQLSFSCCRFVDWRDNRFLLHRGKVAFVKRLTKQQTEMSCQCIRRFLQDPWVDFVWPQRAEWVDLVQEFTNATIVNTLSNQFLSVFNTSSAAHVCLLLLSTGYELRII